MNKTQLKKIYYKSVNEIEGNVHMQINIQQLRLTPTIKYFTCGIPSPLNLRISRTEKMIRVGQAYLRTILLKACQKRKNACKNSHKCILRFLEAFITIVPITLVRLVKCPYYLCPVEIMPTPANFFSIIFKAGEEHNYS